MSPQQIATDLAAYLSGINGTQPFDWQTNNCAHFAGRWWRQATGADALLDLPMPDTAEAAAGCLAAMGANLAAVVGRRLARRRIDPRLAQAGDVVIIGRGYAPACGSAGIGAALGICTGRLAAMLSVEGRVVFGPMVGVSSAFALRAPQ